MVWIRITIRIRLRYYVTLKTFAYNATANKTHCETRKDASAIGRTYVKRWRQRMWLAPSGRNEAKMRNAHKHDAMPRYGCYLYKFTSAVIYDLLDDDDLSRVVRKMTNALNARFRNWHHLYVIIMHTVTMFEDFARTHRHIFGENMLSCSVCDYVFAANVCAQESKHIPYDCDH